MGVVLKQNTMFKSILLVMLLLVTALSPLANHVEGLDVTDANLIISGDSTIEELYRTQPVVFSPSLEWWQSYGDEEVSVLVITRDLFSLHTWQQENGLLPRQSDPVGGERLVESNVELLTGIQHRTIKLPSWKVAKLGGVAGTMVVMEPPLNPEPASNLDEEIPEPTTWAAVDLHGATKAWERNVSGSGVNVAIVDSGIDFAHPDLNGTQARVNDSNSPWNGWPIMFDGRSLHGWLDDADTYPDDGNSWFSDTSQTDNDTDGDGLLDDSGLNVSGIVSQSGVWHIGEHPDSNLQSRVGDDVAILVVDEFTNSSYDTVYVDLDGDGEFGDEVPMRKGSETAGLDLDGDGLWDRSGGLIYFIADGNTSLPYAPTYAARSALADRIPANGDLVSFMINENGGPAGSHGTLCASSVAAQGVIASGKVQGMAPNASLISVGNYYAGGSSFDAWRFVAEGYDGQTDSGDEAQIGSFSFGYSGVVDAGSDHNSVYLDWLTRVYSKNTTYLVALGNGGHGYGTVASPGGAAGIISVGAFSSRTGESAGSTWGESASWSNRGPNSQGRMDPDLVTIGWSATGDVTLNEKTDANSAYRSWSGTSLSTPVAAGLMALLYEAWETQNGVYPDSQTIRDLAMSTASDRSYDPNVQGGGWFDADRATATILGESGTWWMQPASWMPGKNSGMHREANINWMLPGGNDSLNLSFNNPSPDNYWLNMNATTWSPATHDKFIWNSSESGDWDGYQSSRPDIVIPLLIHGDWNNTSIANDSTLVRARATIDPRGFDGNSNYQSENMPYLRIYRWNDTDGDGKWWSDDDGDGQVDSGEWESGNEYSTITEHMYTSPQVEVRIGDPWNQPADGILLGIFRENVRTSQEDPLPIEIDITSFRKYHDPWVSLAPHSLIAPNSTSHIPITITVPSDATSGLRMSSIDISDSLGHNWSFPIVTTIAAAGPTNWIPPEIDGNLSNQTLYRETWMQGAQRWGWRAESGDWKAFAIEWPSNLANGTIIVDVDWPDNGFTDIDAHWLSEIPHPYYQDDPAAYGPWGMAVETGSIGKHRGSGIWERQTSTGGDRELLTAQATPGLKQLILHSTLHGVNTNDNPVNVSVGFAATIAGKLSHSTDDWTTSNISDTLVLGSTVDVSPNDISGWGWTQPELYPGETAEQDVPGSISTASYVREITLEDVRRIKTEIDTANGAGDLDLYLYRDKNSNGVIDWNSEKEGTSGNWNSDEEIVIDNPQNGTWWIVVHGYEVPSATTSFWLRITEIGGTDLAVEDWYELNSSEIQSLCPSGCSALGGEMPKVAWRVNHSMNLPNHTGRWDGFFELELSSGGGLTIPTYFDLIEKPPVLEFRNQVNGVISNQSMQLEARVSDLQAGFNLSQVSLSGDIQIYSDGEWQPLNFSHFAPLANATLRDGSSLNITEDMIRWDDYNFLRNPLLRLPIYDDKLQNWLLFDEPATQFTGYTVIDYRSDIIGTVAGSAEWISDSQRGWVLNLSNNDSSVDFSSSPNTSANLQTLSGTSTMTYWFKSAQNGSDNYSIAPTIAGLSSNSSFDYRWGWINASGNVGIMIGGNQSAISTTSVTDGQWHHIGLSRNSNSGSMEVYIDGLLEAHSVGVTGDLNVTIDQLGCMSNQTNATCANAILDDFRIYSAALGGYTINEIYNSTRMDNISIPSDYELRLLDVSLTVPDIDDRMGWYEITLSATDAANLEDEIQISLGFDTDIPLYFTPFSNVFLTNQTYWEHTILGEANLDLRINDVEILQGNYGDDMWMWPIQTSSTTGGAVWYNRSFPLEIEGVNLFEISATDPAGNYRGSEIYVFKDTISPILFANHSYEYEMVNISTIDIDIETETGVELWVNGDSVFVPATTTNITVPVDLEQGFNLVNITVRDAAGNWANANLTFNVDSIFPSLEWSLPEAEEIVNSHLVPLKWNLSENTIGYISVDGQEWISVPGKSGISYWSSTLSTVGNHEFCLSFEDTGRNKIVECRIVTLNESAYTPISEFIWDGTLTNSTIVYGTLWLGPSQSWELLSFWENSWHSIHEGISPNGGNHTIPFELREGENQFRLIAGGFGISKEWDYYVTLDTISPEFIINDPEDFSRFGYAGLSDLSLRISGVTEPNLFVQCSESDGKHTTHGFADSEGNFSIPHTRTSAENVSDGERVDLSCQTSDAAGNIAVEWLRLDFDGTAPYGVITLIPEQNRLWARWNTNSPDLLDRWNIFVEHDGVLIRSESGYFNASTNSYANQIDLGMIEPGNWSATLQVWDLANNQLDTNHSVIIEEPKTPLSFLSTLELDITSIAVLTLILLTLIYLLDRRKDNGAKSSLNTAKKEAESSQIAPLPIPEISPREAVMAAEAKLELEAAIEGDDFAISTTVSDINEEFSND